MSNDPDAFSRVTAPNWTQAGATPQPAPPQWKKDSALDRFLGGSPATVLLRLVFVSLVVGALMMWLDLRPADLFNALVRFINRIWALGFDAVREVGEYVVAGAMIVVPIWLVLRLLSLRQAR